MSAVTKPVIGILFAGEMGSTLGQLLARQGYRVVTSVAGRSARTCRLACDASLEVVDSVADLVRVADVVFSVVPPGAALAVAQDYCAHNALRREREGRLFVDLNSIAPATAIEVADLCGREGVRFVDGAIHGMASRLPSAGTLYLSGFLAQNVADLFAPLLRVKVLGETAGQASAFKMMISGLAKGVVALLLEMSLTAREANLLEELLTCYRDAYPGIMDLVDRLLPTYPLHAARRGDELREVELTMRGLGLQPCVVSAAQQLTTAVGRLCLADRNPREGLKWSVPEVIEAIFVRNPLQISQESKALLLPSPLYSGERGLG